MELNSRNELKNVLYKAFQNKAKYNEENNTVYYQASVDLEELIELTKGYQVFIQLILF